MLDLAKLREKRASGEKGFTLIELLVVVVIIGILIAIAIPVYLNYKKGAADKSAQSDLRNAINVLEQCNTDNSNYPTALPPASTGTNPCASQSVKGSAGTVFVYNGVAASYVLQASNTNGTAATFYCYGSVAGGSITKSGTALGASTTCPAAS